jgi:uncharacterized protein YajQ (UPF0234 family)
MPSLDIVSQVDSAEILNASENTNREIAKRFDFRGVKASALFTNDVVTISAEADFQCQQLLDIFRDQLIKRKIEPSVMIFDEKALHSGKTFSIQVSFKNGISGEVSKSIVKMIKGQKLRVQAQVQGDQVRVTGKKRDDLQRVMALVREGELGQPFQFKNFKD